MATIWNCSCADFGRQHQQTRLSTARSCINDDGESSIDQVSNAKRKRQQRRKLRLHDPSTEECHVGKPGSPCGRTGPTSNQYTGASSSTTANNMSSSASHLYYHSQHQFSTLQRHHPQDGSLSLVPGKVKTAVSDR